MKLLLLTFLLASSLLANDQIKCLALNIYFEARSSNLADQAAVADVVLNRVESSKYPGTVCKVVKQARLWKGNPVRDKCQFSWYCDGKSDTPKDLDAWLNAQYVAYQMLNHNRFKVLPSSRYST
jgi:spore germination cell wall hydrolase CwlJ-like protein